MEPTGCSIYPYEDKQLTREEVRVIVAEAHIWQKRSDLRWADLRMTNLIGADLREADLHEANLSGTRLENANSLACGSRRGKHAERAITGCALTRGQSLPGKPARSKPQRCPPGVCQSGRCGSATSGDVRCVSQSGQFEGSVAPTEFQREAEPVSS